MDPNLADLFEAVADAVPERPALVCAGRRLTYAEVEDQANRLAHHLLDAGVGSGHHVGMYLHNSVEYVVGMVACLKIRAVPINVNYRYVEAELRYLFDNADLVGLIHARGFIPRIDAVRAEVPSLRTFISVDDGSGEDLRAIGTVSFDEAVGSQRGMRHFAPRSGDDLYIIYTGGTTGMPKGVMWRQGDLYHAGLGAGNPLGEPMLSIEALVANVRARDPQIVQFAVPPLIHGAAQLGVLIAFNWGDKMVLVPRFDPEVVWQAIHDERVNTINLVGDAMARPLAETLAANPDRWDISSLYYVGSTGAVISQSVKEQLRALLPNTIVTENFGATETGHQGMEAMEDARPAGGGLRFQVKETTMVVDDDLRPIVAGSGAMGKLALRGHVPLGYYKDPEKTAGTFFEKDGHRWVVPGDIATVDADGSVIVFGRGSICINSGGEKVFPEEVEQALRSHADVYDAVVVGVPDERWGERVTAVIQPRAGKTPTLQEIDAHCREHVAGYKVPREIHLVEQIQRQPSGKPDYPWAKALATKEPG